MNTKEDILIKVIVVKESRFNNKDKAKFDRIVEIAKSVFGTNGQVEVLMFRKKHYGHTPDIIVLVESEKDLIPDMERKIRERFNYSGTGMNASVSIHKIYTEAADYSEKI